MLATALLLLAASGCTCPVCEEIARAPDSMGPFQYEIWRAQTEGSSFDSEVLDGFHLAGSHSRDAITPHETTMTWFTLGRMPPIEPAFVVVRDGPRPVAVFAWQDDPRLVRDLVPIATLWGAASHAVVVDTEYNAALAYWRDRHADAYPRVRGTPPPPEAEVAGRVWVRVDYAPPDPPPDTPDPPPTTVPTGRTEEVRRAVGELGEILRTETEPVISILWLVDASASMMDDREALAERLPELIADLESTGKAIHLGVIRFDNRTEVLARLGASVQEVQNAILSPGRAGSGDERPLAAAREALSTLRRADGRRVVVIVTDEGGQEDERVLEQTIRDFERAEARAFVLSPQSVFGMRWRFEPDALVGYPVRVDGGPESAGVEAALATPFCCVQEGADPWCVRQVAFDETRRPHEAYYANLDPTWAHVHYGQDVPAGFGIFFMERLARETNGRVIFLDRPRYGDLSAYEPEWIEVREWQQRAMRDPLRQAILRIGEEVRAGGSQQITVQVPGGGLAPIDPARAEVRRWLSELEAVRPPADEPRRWLAARDLLLAQLQGMLVQLEEYRIAYGDGRPEGDAPNGYFLGGSVERRTDDRARRDFLDAVALVRRDHPNTPWDRSAELLARRVRGFQWYILRFEDRGPQTPPPTTPGDR